MTFWKHNIHMGPGAPCVSYGVCFFRISLFTIPIGPHKRHPHSSGVCWTTDLYRALKCLQILMSTVLT
jgi:hypothetical protein